LLFHTEAQRHGAKENKAVDEIDMDALARKLNAPARYDEYVKPASTSQLTDF